ncbi:MAG: Sir2 family NAD-dependent protein deacetylase [Myxococcota bacterium]
MITGAGLSLEGRPGHDTFAGERVRDIATRRKWHSDPCFVRRWLDELRIRCAVALPGPAHEALASLQRAMGARSCVLATTATDGLLQKASAEAVLELRGTVFQARCDAVPDHPRLQISAFEAKLPPCACGSDLRPDVVLAGEPLLQIERLEAAIEAADVVVAAGLDPTIAAWIARTARAAKTHAIAFVGEGWGPGFDERLDLPAEVGIPELVGNWLGAPAR